MIAHPISDSPAKSGSGEFAELRLKQPDRHFAVYSGVFRGHREHFGNRAGYGADVSACSMLARMATSVSGKTASLVDVSSSTDHQR